MCEAHNSELRRNANKHITKHLTILPNVTIDLYKVLDAIKKMYRRDQITLKDKSSYRIQEKCQITKEQVSAVSSTANGLICLFVIKTLSWFVYHKVRFVFINKKVLIYIIRRAEYV